MSTSLWRKRIVERRQTFIGFVLIAAVGLAFWIPRLTSSSDQLTALDRLSYDLVETLRPPEPIDNLRIIEMDSKAYDHWGQDRTSAGLWDRSLHARLVHKLTKDGARIILFDVFFAAPSDSDAEFAEAMRTHGRAGIASELSKVVAQGVRGFEPIFPVQSLKQAAAGIGVVNVYKDSDGAIRRHFFQTESHPSLPWVGARLAGAASLAEANALEPRWFNYYGQSPGGFPKISYAVALDQPESVFRDKFVVIGSTLHIKTRGAVADLFRTPFTRKDGEETSGVTLCALNFLNLVRGDWLKRSSPFTELLLLFAIAFVGSFGFPRLHPAIAAGLALLMASTIAGAAFLLQASERIWFSWLIPVGVQLPLAWCWSLVLYLNQQSRSVEITEATPAVPLPLASPASTVVGQPIATAPVPRVPDHELLRRIGKGAYGEVWLARNAVGLYHAVKIIERRVFEDEAPYEREIRGVTKFMPVSRSHPGFVNILHVRRDDQNGCFYCVMEAADDETLGQQINPDSYSPKNLLKHLRAHKRLPPAECLQLGLRLAEALDYLHKAHLIHRDIKPSNIIFVDGAPKLADIGLVTSIADKPGDISYLGTRGYIAPEGPGTPASDIYSLGKVLYEAFTGLDRDEFPNLPTTVLDATNGKFSKLNLIIRKACETDPKDRYQSAAELGAALEALDIQGAHFQ